MAAKSPYKINTDQCINLIQEYKNREYDEDLTAFKQLFNTTKDFCDALNSDINHGLKADDFKIRDKILGKNSFKKPYQSPNFCKLFLLTLIRWTFLILLVCTLASFIVSISFADDDDRDKDWIDELSLLCMIIIVMLLIALADHIKAQQAIKINPLAEVENTLVVKRQGLETEVKVSDIRVGDIIKITPGMQIPVDGVLVYGNDVITDESNLTGETIDIKKQVFEICVERVSECAEEAKFMGGAVQKSNFDIPSPFLLSGTQITIGDGWFMAIAVGKNSCLGQGYSIMIQREETQQQNESSRVGNMVDSITFLTYIERISVVIALITLFILIVRFIIQESIDGYDWEDEIGDYLADWLNYAIIAVLIVIVATSEWLPLVFIISLSYSVRNMLKDMNFVKRLSSIETMGRVTTICSDKTGTLTMNQLMVKKIWQGEVITLNPQQSQYNMIDVIQNEKTANLLLEGCATNTIGTSKETTATEKAILKMLDKFGCDYQALREKHCKEPLIRFNFTSRRKKMSTIINEVKDNQHSYDKRLHMKGSAEIVLSHCSDYINADGHIVELGKDMRNYIVMQVIEDFAKNAMRTICMAYKDLKPNEGGETHEEDSEDRVNKTVETTGLTLISILGICDTVRPGVPEVIDSCKKAGIRVRMITGDNKITALSIAKECNIIDEEKEDCIMEGYEFYERVGGIDNKTEEHDYSSTGNVKQGVKNMEEFAKIATHLDVLARARPEDKYLLVMGLKEMGEVVAVTGDGTGDAPALKKADVGFAMGITGTEVSKHASDIILLDDNFTSIIKACKWGRNIFYNIRHFLQFQLTAGITSIIIILISCLLLRESPLQPIQLLWIHLIIGLLATISLTIESPQNSLLERPPEKKNGRMVSQKMIKHLIVMIMYQTIIMILLIFIGEYWIPEDPDFNYNRKDKFVGIGRNYDWDGDEKYKKYRDSDNDPGPSRHYTVVFNVFVFMQIFNMINCRRINDELNIFEGILKNRILLVIFVSIVVVQVLIVELTREAFHVSKEGLWYGQWLFSIGIGLSVIPVDFLVKLVPDKLCPKLECCKNKSIKVGSNCATQN